jgi:hypothetical protein
MGFLVGAGEVGSGDAGVVDDVLVVISEPTFAPDFHSLKLFRNVVSVIFASPFVA